MISPSVDVATLRHRNALALFDEFVRATVSHPDAATLRGLERRFAERIGIQPSYWSQIKSRARQVGERLARQFEQHCGKPPGWLDQPHDPPRATAGSPLQAALAPVRAAVEPAEAPRPAVTAAPSRSDAAGSAGPRDDDERFIVDLVLSYYRRNPQRARQRLLDLLGEVLVPAAPPPSAAKAAAPAASPAADAELWSRAQRHVAPLKGKR
ncbi:hypothetical protein [Sphaerotilus microaerophilus]|uniref:Uncharacterized protein n=1 Tax=Sphaerotilus microaerophilus TaxID=2914710 RepID=A0ABM7YGS7_9BURK|nr:hypothetical protein [Sphaerotilus sp. FB-5]BDI03346.1 hypothetical protein CATMQ487_03160 [Sphaerotilus sp. FB-5]